MIPDPLGDAVDWVRGGGLLAYPTETVWGLGADARSDAALGALQDFKGRDAASPVSVLVAGASDLADLGIDLPAPARRLAEQLWPGPLTLVLPASRPRLAAGVAREDGAVGVRCSSHPLAAALARRLRAAGVGPLTATSLNRSGAPAARSRDEAACLATGGRGAPRLLPVDGGEAGGDLESTVVDATASEPRVLRVGAISEDEIASVLRSIPGRGAAR